MNKKELDLSSPDALKFAFFLSNGQIKLVTACSKDRSVQGIISMGWANPTSFMPFLISISIGSGPEETGPIAYRQTYPFIKETREFAVNVPSKELAQAVVQIGTTHSGEVDKYKETGLTPLESKRIGPHLIGECIVNVECKVIQELVTGDHTIFVGEPLTILYNEDVFVDGKFQEKYKDKNNQLHQIELTPPEMI